MEAKQYFFRKLCQHPIIDKPKKEKRKRICFNLSCHLVTVTDNCCSHYTYKYALA